MEKQIEMNKIFVDYVLNTDADIIWQVGGRYSGKSYGMEQLATIKLATRPNYKLLVIEDKEGNVNQGTKAGILSRIDNFGYDALFTDTKKPAEINSTQTKNKALFKGYSTEDQVKQVKALNQITSIWYEEAENVTKDQVEDLYFQLRGGSPEDRKLYLTLNPVNEYCYANEYLIRSTPDEVLEYFPGTKRPKVFIKYVTTEFVHDGKTHIVRLKHLIVITTHHDNAFLEIKQRAAIEALFNTDLDKWKQLAEARFIKSGGTYFNEFDRSIHTCEPFILPSYWRRYFVMDYGLDMLAGYWIAVDEQNKAYVYKEVYESDLIISDAAKRIKSMTNEKIYQHLAPPDLWNRRQETGKSAAEIFNDNGIRLIKTDNSRVQGWLNVKEWLKPFEDEQEILTANLQIFTNCDNLIRCMSQVKRCERNPNDVAKEPHELTHAPDAIRGFLAGRPIPYRSTKVKPIDYINKFVSTKPKTGGFMKW